MTLCGLGPKTQPTMKGWRLDRLMGLCGEGRDLLIDLT